MPFPTVEDEAYDRLHKAMGQLKDARLVLTVALMRAEKDAGPGA